jgi:multidrug efflux pump subunit AcrA (membrane-fusion protein)
LIVLLLLSGCHDHDGDGHAHGDASAHAEEAAEPAPISITKWTESYELFVEIPPPVKDAPISYHAHVTRLSDFHAVTEGRFTVRYKDGAGKVVKEHAITGVKRPGIFVFEGEGLPVGEYPTEMTYEVDGKADTWDCGVIPVLAAAPAPEAEAASTSITFLKESQWKITFATAWAEERPVRRQLELPGTVEPAGTDQLTIGAPTGGRFLHDPRRTLTVGLKVEKGDTLGTVVPNVADEDYSRLAFAVEEAAIAKKQNEGEIARVEPMVKEGLLPQKRLIDLQNEHEVAESRLRLAQQRLGALAGDGKAGLPVKAGMTGVISEVIGKNGDTVAPGAPLVRLGGSQRLWVRAKTFARGPFEAPVASSLRLEGGAPVDLAKLGATFLSPAPTVDPSTRVGTWLIDLGPSTGDLPEFRPGTAVVTTVRFGAAADRVVVPTGAVVEIDTRSFVFVQIDGEHFEKRPVAVEPSDEGFTPVTRGVQKGERVVSTGGFDIHLAAVMGTVESHRH